MTDCPNCNTKCVEGANYCHMCGIYLFKDSNSHADPSFLNPSNQEEVELALRRLMPANYVNKLLSNKGKVEGEKRVVTILFSDVKGSTSLAENLDPEEVLDIMNGAFEILIKPITRYEGTIARLMGDAILAFFGAPIAHEDDPDRACMAALDIIKGAKEYGKKLAKEKNIEGFNVRVGINTGMVVVAEVGTDLRVEYTAMGDAVNTAARMESSAETGTIMITEDTKKLIENNFEIASLGAINVKGKEKPLNVYQLLGVKKVISKIEHQNGFYSQIVGREKELDSIMKIIELLSTGKGNIIAITGEHGIGKSRLIYECRNKLSDGMKWLKGRALAYNINDSYWIIRDILNKIIFSDNENNKTNSKKILKDYIHTFPNLNLEEVYPYISFLLNIDIEKKYKNKIQLNDAKTLKGQIHYACRELIRQESLKEPMTIVLEDLHWSDSSSRELLKELFSLAEQTPILFVLDYRLNEGDMLKFHEYNLKNNRKNFQIYQLKELSTENSIQLVNNLTVDYFIPSELKDDLIEKTGGNPLFIEEVIRSFIDQGFISKDQKDYKKKSKQDQITVPNLLQNVITSRLDCLDTYQKLVLQSASLIGRLINEELLLKIMLKHKNEGDFQAAIKELIKRGFIYEQNNGKGKISTKKRDFFFKHTILQDSVSNSLLKIQKRKLHTMIADEMEILYSDKIQDLAGTLGSHYEEGQDFNKAIIYYKIAADNSKNVFANDEAILFYSKIIDFQTKVKMKEKDLVVVYESLGDLFFLTAEYAQAVKNFKNILDLSTENKIIGTIFYKCGKVYERWGKYNDALLSYNEGLKLIESLDIKDIHAKILTGMGMVAYRKGDLDTAEKQNFEALRIFNGTDNEIDLADVYNNLGIIFCKRKNLEKAKQYHKKCLAIREKHSHTSGLAASYNNLGYLFQLSAEYDKAIDYYEKSISYCEKTGNLHGLARTFDNLSQVYLKKENADIAMTYNLKAITILGKIAVDGSAPQHDIWLQSGVW